MVKCAFCEEETGILPFNCKSCGKYFCAKHRLPENHQCTHDLPIKENEKDSQKILYKNVIIEDEKHVAVKKVPEFDLSKISDDLEINKVTKSQAIANLAEFIKHEKHEHFRLKVLDLIVKFKLTDDPVNKILEECLIEDKSKLVKKEAMNILIDLFPKKNFPLFKRFFSIEKNFKMMMVIADKLNIFGEPKFQELKDTFLNNLSNLINLVPEECVFMIDWTKLWDPNFEDTTIESLAFDFRCETYDDFLYAESADIYVVDKHIIGLKLGGYIPESIGNLSHLKYLDIGGEANLIDEIPKSIIQLKKLENLYIEASNLSSVPEFLADLPSLKNLGLSGVNLTQTPEWLFQFAKKNYVSKYVEKGVNEYDAAVLGLFDILLGRELYDVKKPEWYEGDIKHFGYFDEDWYNSNMAMKTWHYKIDDSGNIIGLYIRNYGERDDGWLNYIPPEICQLKNLKEVSIGPREDLYIDKKTQEFFNSLHK
ncbi:MAG: AN1-type zinc finger domain-containing protein [Candidatus Thorarchaeota archaeon]